MDINLIFAIIFFLLLAIFLYANRKKISISGLFPLIYVFMIRSKFGLKAMDKIAKKNRKLLKTIGMIGVVIGFIGMAFVSFEILYNTIKLLFNPATAVGAQLVLPISAKGIFYVPFMYWILAIFIVAFFHEFSHGLFGRAYKIPLVSTGIAIVGVIIPLIPAAFVEPNEKKFKKFSKKAKLTMLAAGPFANIIMGILIVLLLIPITPFVTNFYTPDGVEITQLAKEGPAKMIGMAPNTIITEIDSNPVKTLKEFKEIINQKKPGDIIKIRTNEGTFDVPLAEKNNRAYVGINIKQHSIIKKGRSILLAKTVSWIYELMIWVYLLSLGIGLFNLLPVGPLDGGRMLNELLGKQGKQRIAFKVISLFFFALILINIFSGFFK
ncbi:hypothetical protein DRJ25_04290 [Candidatus Woesearchaeota archaeon]|nr:MAG: hypothetical protein DRJ25_04290 [Candidatus Woesearchaeota archaeon]